MYFIPLSNLHSGQREATYREKVRQRGKGKHVLFHVLTNLHGGQGAWPERSQNAEKCSLMQSQQHVVCILSAL